MKHHLAVLMRQGEKLSGTECPRGWVRITLGTGRRDAPPRGRIQVNRNQAPWELRAVQYAGSVVIETNLFDAGKMAKSALKIAA